jgi:hypothetical protein
MPVLVFPARNKQGFFQVRVFPLNFNQTNMSQDQMGQRQFEAVQKYFREGPKSSAEWRISEFAVPAEKVNELVNYLIVRDHLQVQVGDDLFFWNSKETAVRKLAFKGHHPGEFIYELAPDGRLTMVKRKDVI